MQIKFTEWSNGPEITLHIILTYVGLTQIMLRKRDRGFTLKEVIDQKVLVRCWFMIYIYVATLHSAKTTQLIKSDTFGK